MARDAAAPTLDRMAASGQPGAGPVPAMPRRGRSGAPKQGRGFAPGPHQGALPLGTPPRASPWNPSLGVWGWGGGGWAGRRCRPACRTAPVPCPPAPSPSPHSQSWSPEAAASGGGPGGKAPWRVSGRSPDLPSIRPTGSAGAWLGSGRYLRAAATCGLRPFEDRRDALAAADAHRHQGVAPAGPRAARTAPSPSGSRRWRRPDGRARSPSRSDWSSPDRSRGPWPPRRPAPRTPRSTR